MGPLAGFGRAAAGHGDTGGVAGVAAAGGLGFVRA
jgi:hypothetical protein